MKSLKQIQVIAASLRKAGKKIVFTNGCFDILHYGHVMYLDKAKTNGDILIVGVNSDSSIKRIKGDLRPIINEYDRLRVVLGLKSVDYAFIFKENTPLNLIKSIKPDVLIKGADWSENNIVGAEFVKSYGGKIKTIKLAKGRSTSNIINKIGKLYQQQ
ncbi:MAG: D-glycero-beta-D-manno-heptose 1-phosphate adenylyltransferase [Candidatus Omnitrophica bacterium]|nr:D-glycero-beta-D-manno-heptose 1-phosphate adenylyltransferase [Candidatus Omnitrophota bacterium]